MNIYIYIYIYISLLLLVIMMIIMIIGDQVVEGPADPEDHAVAAHGEDVGGPLLLFLLKVCHFCSIIC